MSSSPALQSASVAPDSSGIFGQPRGLTNLFFTELWERFGYYGMRALLTYFMTKPLVEGGLNFDIKLAANIYGTYTMSVYLLSIPGGYIADNFIGARASVLWGGIAIAIGYFSLAIHDLTAFYAGLVLVAIGTGLLKPNVSSMVGSLYSREDPRRDAGFSIFYMGINAGALFGPILTGWLAQSDEFKAILASHGLDPARSWHWAFATSGIGMVIGLVIYLLQLHRLAGVGHPPAPGVKRPWGTMLGVLGASAVVFALVRLSDTDPRFEWIRYGYVVLPVLAIIWFGTRADLSMKRFAAVFVFSLAYLIFCAVFEQAGSTISLFADQLTRTELFGYKFPSAWFQSVNSVFVILLSPIFAWIWIKLGTKAPTSPMKFAISLFFLALSFAMMIPAAQLTATGKISPFWIVGLFFVQTVSELCLSPVGLSTLTKLAPPQLVGSVMGVWFLAAALGNKLAGVLAGDFNATDAPALADFFMRQAIWVGIACVGLIALARWVKKLMGDVH